MMSEEEKAILKSKFKKAFNQIKNQKLKFNH